MNGAPLQSRDINHKHGSIHTLGRVLWPVAEDSVQLYLDANPFLSQFASWYRNFARVSKNDMVTVFAPTNAAFERVAPSIRKNLAKNDVLKASEYLQAVGGMINTTLCCSDANTYLCMTFSCYLCLLTY